MKLLLRALFIYLPMLLLAVILCLILVIWQQDLVSREDLRALDRMIRSQGLEATLTVIQVYVSGTSELATDPGYGRKAAAGRGHTPWVLRSNLDGKPRMLSFALAPGVWAAYDTSNASLYQVWQGEILFQGAVYDYIHGPQPEATGAWVVRHEQPHQWVLRSEDTGEQWPATVRYLGHEYGPQHETAGFRFVVEAGDLHVELTEYPELEEKDGQRVLLRQFQQHGGPDEISAAYDDGSGEWTTARDTIRIPLGVARPIFNEAYVRSRSASDSDLETGERVIMGSGCLSCHNEQQHLTGPAWSRVAGRFGGKLQDASELALARSIIEGSVDKWGQVPMPPHPELSFEDARAAAIYILSRPEQELTTEAPVDEDGEPYPATRDYDIDRRLEDVHPAFSLDNLLPEGFEPKVGGMDFRADGKLLVASWDRDGAVFLIDPTARAGQSVQRIAEGLHEPLGLVVVGQRLFVLQKQELTELVDRDGDDVIDEYRAFTYGWPTSSNFHSFAFGLVHRGDYLYALLSICVMPGGASCPEQLPTQGKLLRIALADGNVEIIASGFRTPNGIGLGVRDEIFVTDNQGDWLPASKLVHIQEGHFYGSRAVPDEELMQAEETLPVVWLPQDEIGNSPSQPLLMNEGPYTGQMIYGDVTNGGIKRVYMERVGGAWQGAAFHFSAGLQGAVNRLLRGPDGSIYVGEIGNPPNWGETGKAWHGLERLSYRGGPAFEVLQINAEPDGFSLTLTEPLHESIQLEAGDLIAKQWFYHPTEQYGGAKYDHSELPVTTLELSPDRRRIKAEIPDLKAGYVVYLHLDPRLVSNKGQSLWVGEAWYTLNAIPRADSQVERTEISSADDDSAEGWKILLAGKTLGGWRNYGDPEGSVENWKIEDGVLALQPSRFSRLSMIAAYLFGGGTGDLIYAEERFRNFELSLEWRIAENGNSGILYLVADEDHAAPWQTGPEMQVLHNEGHPDGRIDQHRAGDLYDLVAAKPETVRGPGEWNHVLIRIQDDQIEHWLNGAKVVDIKRGGAEWEAALAASKFADMPDFGKSDEGYIVLQDHGDLVWYRNMKIRRLRE